MLSQGVHTKIFSRGKLRNEIEKAVEGASAATNLKGARKPSNQSEREIDSDNESIHHTAKVNTLEPSFPQILTDRQPFL